MSSANAATVRTEVTKNHLRVAQNSEARIEKSSRVLFREEIEWAKFRDRERENKDKSQQKTRGKETPGPLEESTQETTESDGSWRPRSRDRTR